MPHPTAGRGGPRLLPKKLPVGVSARRSSLAIPKASLKIEEHCVRPSKSADGAVAIIDRWGVHPDEPRDLFGMLLRAANSAEIHLAESRARTHLV
ncbi:Ornithine cyclodeaminase [Mesorhizobium escarrei]|uniref:Ornithine cyclodeaminase n=1 Tax=Mesorhizobium escarrei TaxID=666018 RepID=A0ABN8K1D0_9HYPH|nr:Ornithine cyclodeaminase [Mesorhizobium escarrei]